MDIDKEYAQGTTCSSTLNTIIAHTSKNQKIYIRGDMFVCKSCRTKSRNNEDLCRPCKDLYDKGLLQTDDLEQPVPFLHSVANDPGWYFISVNQKHNGFIKTTEYQYADKSGNVRTEIYHGDKLVYVTPAKA